MKTLIAIACLVLMAGALAEARPKRSVVLASPAVVAAVPAATVVHHSPTTVVKTEQVHDGVRSSYSYSTEVKSPVVHTHAAVAAAPAVVSHAVAAVPTYAHYNYAYHPSYAYGHYYSPYSYVLGK